MAGLVRLEVGATFAGDFKILRVLRGGPQRAVYVVEQLSTGRQLALKTLAPEATPDDASRAEFVEQLRSGGRVHTDHVVDVRAAGVDPPTGMPWLVMEFLDGADLASVLEKYRDPWPLTVWDEVLTQILRGLAAVHRAGLVAGGLGPDSVFLALPRSGNAPFRVELLDVAMPRAAQNFENRAALRAAYLAPELEGGATPTAGSDLWSVAMLAFLMLTGRSYWRAAPGDTRAVRAEVLAGTVEPASTRAASFGAPPLPGPFDEWFARCTRADVSARYPDAEQALDGAADLLAEASGVGIDDISFDVDGGLASRKSVRLSAGLPVARGSIRGAARPPPLPAVVGVIAKNPRPAIAALVLLVVAALGVGVRVGSLLAGRRGDGGTGTRAKALVWARGDRQACASACDRGDASACHGLALSYRNALKVGRDDAQAAAMFRRACDGGDLAACGGLAAQYLAGEGVAEDSAQAIRLYGKACEGGDGVSCMDLSDLYAQGTSVGRDPERAKALRQAACKTGLNEACQSSD